MEQNQNLVKYDQHHLAPTIQNDAHPSKLPMPAKSVLNGSNFAIAPNSASGSACAKEDQPSLAISDSEKVDLQTVRNPNAKDKILDFQALQ